MFELDPGRDEPFADGPLGGVPLPPPAPRQGGDGTGPGLSGGLGLELWRPEREPCPAAVAPARPPGGAERIAAPALPAPNDWNGSIVLGTTTLSPLVLATSEVQPSPMSVSSLGLSVMVTTATAPPPTFYESGASGGYHPPGLSAYRPLDDSDPDPDEHEDRASKVYNKPAGRVAGTALLFLCIGLVFLRGRRGPELG